MRQPLRVDKFIRDQIIGREESLFQKDLEAHDELLSERIGGGSVLVIGGAGTIGSSYIKAILKYRPASLYVFDLSENGLTELVRDLRSTDGMLIPEVFKLYPVDYSSEVAHRIIRDHGVFDIVAHFAAHKHVRSEKDVYSIEAMFRNNVVNNLELLQLLSENPPGRFFGVSTDKAANPVNVMGATKRIMEELLLSFDNIRITTARFANVAFSNGSLLDGFLNRLHRQQPLSAPKTIKRYFVSPEESGQLCLIANILGTSGQIFFPKLEETEMCTFTDIAERLLIEIGMTPYYCSSEEEARQIAKGLSVSSREYPVYFFDTDTSGEKMFEEFYTNEDNVDLDSFEALGVINSPGFRPKSDVIELIGRSREIFEQSSVQKSDVIEWLHDVLPNFAHVETGKNLDQRM